LSTENREFVKGLFEDYKADGRLTIWDMSNFQKLSRRLVNLLGVRDKVENLIATANDNLELTEKLSALVKSFVPNASEQFTLTLCQCFMKNFSVGQAEHEIKEKIYVQWVVALKERSAK
jgi:hypothetical protein